MWRLIKIYWRLGILNELQYRINFFVQLFQSLLALGTGLVALTLIFNYTPSLRGWDQPELLMVMGVHILMGGIIKMGIQPNMQRIIGDVQAGTLDYTLTKPEDSQLLVSVREVRIWQLVDVVIGLIVLIVATFLIGESLPWTTVIIFPLTLLMGSLLIYGLWLMLTTTAFWIIRAENLLEIYQSMYQAGRWPVDIYPGWLRGTLTFLVPVAFAVTVPAEALTARLTPSTLLGMGVLTAVILIASRQIWRWGLRNYSGASA